MSAAILRGSAQPLSEVYDVALVDLDGVVYIGERAVPHAADALAAARAVGMVLAFVTNNASRTPAVVASHLTSLGVAAAENEVVTSSMAAAHLLTTLVPAGSTVLVVGGEGLHTAVAAQGFVPTQTATDQPAAVVQGYGPDVSWQSLAEATIAVRRGVPWVATNLDTTLPSSRGLLPGNGALVAAVTAATDRMPISAGKPELPLHEEAVRRTNARRPLVIGDRLDTDIESAVRANAKSLLVMTGVTDVAQLLAAPPQQRPTYVALDLRGLNAPHPPVNIADCVVTCGGWRATRKEETVDVTRLGADDDAMDALRVALTAAWLEPAADLDIRGDIGPLQQLGLKTAS